MRPRTPVPEALTRLAELQGGIVTREQAAAFGLGRNVIGRLVNEGWWRRIAGGVYLTRNVDPTWTGWAWSGVLLGGDRARIGGRAAAHLHGFGRRAPGLIQVLIPAEVRCRRDGPWEFRRERPGVRSARSPGSPPRTTVEDTVVDLCDEGAEDQVAEWVSAAIRERVTTVDRLRAAAGRRRQLKHRRVLRDVLGDVGGGAESPLEIRYLRDVERAHGLPTGVRQVVVPPYRSDVRYPAYGTVVELDGRLGHEGEDRFRDMWRDNTFAVDGQVTLRYGWRDVTGRQCDVAVQVASVLAQRGCSDPPHPCPRCRRSDVWSMWLGTPSSIDHTAGSYW